MKKCVCYVDESTLSVYQADCVTSLYVGVLSSINDLAQLTESEKDDTINNNIDEMIALKKAGFSAAEIIELKQAKLM